MVIMDFQLSKYNNYDILTSCPISQNYHIFNMVRLSDSYIINCIEYLSELTEKANS
jgi:hypothetical protein